MMSALNLESIAVRIYKWGRKKPQNSDYLNYEGRETQAVFRQSFDR